MKIGRVFLVMFENCDAIDYNGYEDHFEVIDECHEACVE